MLACAAVFGLQLRRTERERTHAWAAPTAARVDAALGPGQIALLTGPSGAGKSVLMRALRRRLGRRGVFAGTDLPARRTLVELHGGRLDVWLRTLAAVGLAEGRLLTQPVGTLSEGQRWRAALGLCFARAARRSTRRGGPTSILVDEFASMLDRQTAAGLCETVRRLMDRAATGLRLIGATAHDDVLEGLRPDVVVQVPLECGDPTQRDASPEVLMP